MTTLDQVRDLSIKSDFEAFDVIARHLLSQKEKCFGFTGDCGYRGYDESVSFYPEIDEIDFEHESGEAYPNGKTCAVGILIKDAFYDPEIEGLSISDIIVKDAVNFSHPDWVLNGITYSLISSLQSVHDRYWPKDWPVLLIYLSEFFHKDDDGKYCLREEIPFNWSNDPKFALYLTTAGDFDADAEKLLNILDEMKGVK